VSEPTTGRDAHETEDEAATLDVADVAERLESGITATANCGHTAWFENSDIATT
jgi:hypothetical protein